MIWRVACQDCRACDNDFAKLIVVLMRIVHKCKEHEKVRWLGCSMASDE